MNKEDVMLLLLRPLCDAILPSNESVQDAGSSNASAREAAREPKNEVDSLGDKVVV